MNRLRKEHGELFSKFADLVRQCSYVLAGTIHADRSNLAMGDVFFDLFETYAAIVRDDVAYLSKKESILWMLHNYLVPKCANSIVYNSIRLNIKDDELFYPPDPYWYLPSITDGEVSWPLARVINSVYRECRSDRLCFYRSAGEVVAKQREENALNWINSVSIPSWHALFENFDEPLSQFENFIVNEDKKSSFIFALFMARLSTYVCKVIYDKFGLDVLQSLIAMFREETESVERHAANVRGTIQHQITLREIPEDRINFFWYENTDKFWRLSYKDYSKLWWRLENLDVEERYIESEPVKAMIDRFGKYHVEMGLRQLVNRNDFCKPVDFDGTVSVIEGMSHKEDISSADIDKFVNDLQLKQLHEKFDWAVLWLMALAKYRSGDYQMALQIMEQCFEKSKYRAGKFSQRIVNQFTSLAAINKKKVLFRKGIDWSRYANIKLIAPDLVDSVKNEYPENYSEFMYGFLPDIHSSIFGEFFDGY
ncbi:hypothetical protein [Paludibacterium denitrificans]|uniref:Uncharacterized protein n=1 Tax=Paludibacterium denitrificans TaxID=2675226 RepID=A0A844GI10_9NEIS|nr:hypothetical protein [Paludibacterium denitrificans]MTD34125.1 hypothetical protein [Paludibacterium denitrificans]